MIRRALLFLLLCAPAAWGGPPVDDGDTGTTQKASAPALPTYTAAGTAQDANVLGVSSLTVANVTAAAGDAVVVCLADDGTADVSNVAISWSSATFARRVTGNLAGDPEATIFSAYNAPGGTADLTIDLSSSPPQSAACAVSVIHNVAVSPQDKTKSATGTSTSPSTGASAATTQASEIVIGAIATAGPDGDDPGTWSGGYTAGQRLGTTALAPPGANVTVADGYLVVSSTGAQTAAKTGITSRTWAAALVTLKAK